MWAMVDWAGKGLEPAHIWCFLELKGLPECAQERKKKKMVYGKCHHINNGLYAVVEVSSFVNAPNGVPKSRLFRPLVKEMARNGADKSHRQRKFCLLPVAKIREPAYVIPDIGCKNGCTYFLVKKRNDWILEMEDWLEEPYPAQYTSDKEGNHLH